MMREILDKILFKNGVQITKEVWLDIDQALAQIKTEIMGKLPKEMPEKELWALPKISLVHIAQGRNEVIAQVKQIIEAMK